MYICTVCAHPPTQTDLLSHKAQEMDNDYLKNGPRNIWTSRCLFLWAAASLHIHYTLSIDLLALQRILSPLCNNDSAVFPSCRLVKQSEASRAWSTLQLNTGVCAQSHRKHWQTYMCCTNTYMRTCTCSVGHCLRHSPAGRLSRADLLSRSRALEVEDLMWSLKDLCSSSSLMERDMPISIHRIPPIYVRLLPCPAPASDRVDYCAFAPRQSRLFSLLLFFSLKNIYVQAFDHNLTSSSV